MIPTLSTEDSNEDYVVAPDDETLWPGDIFPDVPLPLLRYPLQTYRPDEKARRKGQLQVFAADGTHKSGDIAHCVYQSVTVMLLSHGCEIEKAVKPNSATRTHLLVAPLEPFSEAMSDDLRARIRAGQQPNRLYLPSTAILPGGEYCVDLRRIIPVPAQMLLDRLKARLGTLHEDAKYDLAAQLGVYFSGLALYVQDISCPHCGGAVSAEDFTLASDDTLNDGFTAVDEAS